MKIFFVVAASFLTTTFAAQAQNPYQPAPLYMNAPQAPQSPTMRHVMTPDGRSIQVGQGMAPQRQQPSYETTRFPTRLVYLNGQNITATKNQTLENVSVRIDEMGNIHLTAPHYEIATDSSYHPLLPSELPRFPKDQIRIDGLPQGVFSKDPQAARLDSGAASKNEPRMPLPPSALGSSRPSLEDNPPPITPPSDPNAKPQKAAADDKATSKPEAPAPQAR